MNGIWKYKSGIVKCERKDLSNDLPTLERVKGKASLMSGGTEMYPVNVREEKRSKHRTRLQ